MRCTRLRISIFACFSLFVWFVLNRKQSGVMRSSQKIADPKSYFTPEEKELKWTVCRQLIAGQGKVGKTRNPHPLAPGGIIKEERDSIPRALHWNVHNTECHGQWVRSLCWITAEDLRWALGSEMKYKLFVHKIPFDYDDDLLECILVARQGRKYGSILWREA
ncbi:uncharacterized protein LOC141889154 isoform X2 [Acropora palmata]|uniref:uncharacterized protein LOC141889154 isoform X2 n=1 Tax=Acropora palmata TaxID=6131 RepID=UPI003DA1C40D